MSEPLLPPLIRSLLDPAAYPHPAERVELIQTHISYVLLAGDYVYKVKKPVDLGFLNFTTQGRRRFYCRREVELNRRLCPGTYLGVVAITEAGGRSRVGGRGRVVEYAVQMRRLPQERILRALLERGAVSAEMVRAVAERVADFHARAHVPARAQQYGRALFYNWRENFRQTEPFLGRTLSVGQHAFLHSYVEAFARRRRALVERRAAGGFVRDCHGDLHSDAVCFTDGLCIFDCIEFNRRFRYTDVAGDVSFLAMDLDFHGREDLADAFVNQYVQRTGDSGLLRMLGFYRCYRAYVRGKVEGFRLDEAETPEAEKPAILERARRFFALAARYAADERWPLLVITCGLTGTGKSAVGQAVAERLGLEVIASDVVRKELAGVAPTERHEEPFERGIYSPEATRRTYEELLRRARRGLEDGHSVLLDATFGSVQQRAAARALAEEVGADFFCIETVLPPELVRRRLERRRGQAGVVSDGRWEIYLAQQERFRGPEELSRWERITVSSRRPPERVAESVARRIGEPPRRPRDKELGASVS